MKKKRDTGGMLIKKIQAVMNSFDADLKGHRVVLFGSRAKNRWRPHSDFDIGIIGEDALPLSVFFQLEDQLEKISTLHTLELVDFQRTPKDFQKEAFKTLQTIFST